MRRNSGDEADADALAVHAGHATHFMDKLVPAGKGDVHLDESTLPDAMPLPDAQKSAPLADIREHTTEGLFTTGNRDLSTIGFTWISAFVLLTTFEEHG
jgi:hypothetical protein